MLEKIILPAVLALLMFGLGMNLVKDDFIRVATRKYVIFIGLVSVLFLMPVTAYFVGSVLQLSAVLAMGLILLAACPGGMFSNLVTHTARGDLALSITLTVLSSFLYVLSVPIVISVSSARIFGEGQHLSLSFSKIFFEVFLVVLVPLAFGMILRRMVPDWCIKRERMVRNLSSVFIMLVFVGLGIDQFDFFASSGMRTAGAVLLLNLLGWVLAISLALTFRFSRKELIAVGVEHSIRQEGTGVFIAATVIGSKEMIVPLLLNSMIGLVISSILLLIIRRHQIAPAISLEGQ